MEGNGLNRRFLHCMKLGTAAATAIMASDDIAQQPECFDDWATEIAALTLPLLRSIRSLSGELDKREDVINRQAGLINELRLENSGHVRNVEDLSEQIGRMSDDVEKLARENRDASESIEKLSAEILDLERRLKAKDSEIGGLSGKLKRVRAGKKAA